MDRLLITQSLISSWQYMFSCYEECADSAREEFYKTLARSPRETTEEMQNGIDFEAECYKAAAGIERPEHTRWESGIQAVASRIRNAPTQIKLSRPLTIDGREYLVYGILDALKAGTIYDVKFSNKSFQSAQLAGKYLDSPQHPLYFYLCPEAKRFTYLVSDGTDLYTETYTPDMCRSAEAIIREFIGSIGTMGLLPLYREKWVSLS